MPALIEIALECLLFAPILNKFESTFLGKFSLQTTWGCKVESFEGCNYIKYVNFPKSVKEIGQAAFKGCVRLENVKLPSVMQAIRREAFSGCTNMTKLMFPLSLETLESYELLANCFSLKEVKFPLRSLTDGDRLEVYTLDGHRIYSGRATSSQAEIPVTPNNVYIVRINALSLKVCL